ncbi:MAG: gamma-glutamyltransferase [Sphingobium sp.]
MIRYFLSLLLLCSLPSTALATGTVSSADARASEAGMEMLRQGGTATDAAMAMMLALTVVEPQSSGIGGGGFLVHHDGKRGLIDTIDGRETAPSSARPDRFLDENGKPLPFMQAVVGGKSVGVPGNIALMKKAHDKWGKLPWATLFQPAIKLARDGFVVDAPLARSLSLVSRFWTDDIAAAKAIYWIDGRPALEGETIKNPELAALLTRIASEGPDAFYVGAAAEITDTLAKAGHNPALMTLDDLRSYRAKERPAVCAPYRVYTVCGMGPPSSGATTVLQILGMLERFDLHALGRDNPQSWHLIGEAMQLAYADRGKYLADRDFLDVPVAGLLDPAYMRRRSALISPSKARGQYEPGTPPGAAARTNAPHDEVPGTTHFIAIDDAGDIVSMTSTVEGPFGSQLVVHGFVLNNELTDFNFAPEENGAPVANRVERGKRPLSSMSPTIVYNASGKPVFVVGAAGGKTIIMQVAKAIIAHLDWGMSARDAIGLGLLYYNKDGLLIEQGSTIEDMKAPLEAMGHRVGAMTYKLKANAAERLPDGGWRGAADPRSVGVAVTE